MLKTASRCIRLAAFTRCLLLLRFSLYSSARASLLSSVSHDLRTPLSVIKTAATSLLRKEIRWDEEALHSFASTIERKADRLNRLVENLLDMSRIEGGALYPEKVWYPLDELVHDVLGRMHSQLQGRIVQMHLPDDLPPVKLDYVQIDQVVTNLIENAVHYTPAGSPIDVSIEAQEEQTLVSIADRGPGISLTERERIFDKFYRGDSYASGYNPGSGIGLAVCRGLVEAHGGRIRMEGREGGGALFHFTLPQDKTEGRQQ
jgi:two-component system, OmpR family, sensor histidine kinase KdpD